MKVTSEFLKALAIAIGIFALSAPSFSMGPIDGRADIDRIRKGSQKQRIRANRVFQRRPNMERSLKHGMQMDKSQRHQNIKNGVSDFTERRQKFQPGEKLEDRRELERTGMKKRRRFKRREARRKTRKEKRNDGNH